MKLQQEFMQGADVYGADGGKVGTVASMDGSYIVVEKGFFFPKDYYIPVGAVTDSTDDAVYLAVTKDQALDQGWDTMPTETQGTDWQQTQQTDGPYAQGTTGQYSDQRTESRNAEQGTLRVPVHEEHLDATKRTAKAGDVKINKRVVTEQETIDVPVTEERVRVDWRAPSGEMTADGQVFEEGSIEVPVSREVVDVSKHTVQTGELEVTKDREQRTQKVTDSVRREVIDVEDTSDTVTTTGKAKRK
jgi:uncharacterized protein (TIGR02271 family)